MKKSRLSKIKSARSLRDLSAILKAINAEVKKLDSSVSDLTLSVSSGKVRSIDDIGSDDLTRTKGGGLPKNIKDFKKPDIKALVKNSDTLETFAQDIAELEALRNTLLSEQFSTLPNTDKLRREAEKSIKEAKASRDKQLKAMKLAANKKPKEAKSFTASINKHLLSLIPDEDYSEIKQFSFILVPQGRTDVLWYQTYITIRDFVVGGEFVFDRYTFVVTSEVEFETGDLKHFVTTLKSDSVPGSFSTGTEVKTPNKAKQVINTYLSADDFNVEFGRRVALQPVYDSSKKIKKANKGITTTKLRHDKIREGSNFTLSDFDIAKVRIQNDRIYFRFEAGVDEQEVAESKDRIFVALRTYLGSAITRRTSLVSEIQKRSGRIYLVISLVPPKSKGEQLLSDIDQFATRFGLDKTSKSRLKRFMVND